MLLVPVLRAQPDRSAPPGAGPPPALRLPPIQNYSLSSGTKVVLLERHSVPIVQINLLVRAGTSMDPAGKGGLASITAAMLTEGAGPRGALEFADAVDYLGAQVAASARLYTTTVALHTPLSKLDSGLVLLADLVRRPKFLASELARVRTERLTTILQMRDDPDILASLIFRRTLYGEHPYGAPSLGNAASLASMTVDDLRGFHGAYFIPANTTIIVVGDITGAEIMPKLESAFGEWNGNVVSPPPVPPVPQKREKTLVFVDKPGSAQSVITIGRIGAARLTDDYYAIVVMNALLGGPFTSRLNMNLREAHGYSYGASSEFDFLPLPGPFVATASVQTDVTDKALTEFVNELRGILKPVPDADLERVKNYLALGYPGEFQSVAQIASQLEELAIYGLPDDYFNGYIGRIRAITQSDVERVARKYINTDDLVFIIVGDRKEIAERVTALNLAPAKFLSVEDVLGPAPVLEGGK
jgi:predicted Zn-dependent peptidase